MTREEIIEHLDSIVGTYEILLGHGVNSDILDVDDIEAIKEAISALSENKGDLISRQEILDRTVNRNSIWNTITDSEGNNLEDILDSIPSVEKKGEWKRTYLDHVAMGERPSILYCSVCCQCIAYPTNYCPNCGADMRGEA